MAIKDWTVHEDAAGDWRIRSGDGHHLATIVGGKEAAHLMCAAPKLLEALEEVCAVWDDWNMEFLEMVLPPRLANVRQGAAEAIAEAQP